MRGPPLRTRSGASSPSWASARGRLASMTMSARRTRSCRIRTPVRSCRSSATDRLRPFIRSKNSCGPRRAPSGRCLDSTFTTRAPARASRSPHSGPAQSADRSTTTMPSASDRGRASPRDDRDTPTRSAASPTRAAGSPRSWALARRSVGSRRRRFDATADHIAGTESGTASSSSHAGTASMSSARGSETAMKPSVTGRRRQLPPQLVAPRRQRPINAARSPRSANASKPGNDRARRSIPSTRPSGGPSGWSGSPVSAMAPLSAQRSTRGSSTVGRVTSRDPRTPQRRLTARRAAQRHQPRAQWRGDGRPRRRDARSRRHAAGWPGKPALRPRWVVPW